MFKYDDGMGHVNFSFPNFTPKFLDEADKDVVANATKTCKNNTQCIFDLVFTGNEELAQQTTDTEDKSLENKRSAGSVHYNVVQLVLLSKIQDFFFN